MYQKIKAFIFRIYFLLYNIVTLNTCPYRYHQVETVRCKGKVCMRASMTAYHWDKESGKPNPNAPFLACDGHYEDYREYWQSQWDEYNSGRF